MRVVCTDCGWSAGTEEYSREEVNGRAIQHHVKTAHRVVSTRRLNPTERWMSGDVSD